MTATNRGDELLRRYRSLIVNDVEHDHFIKLRYRITPAKEFDILGAGIRLLLILSQRTLLPLGFETVTKHDVSTVGAVVHHAGPLGGGEITIALPTHVVSEREGLTQLILTATSAAEYNYTSELWLDDIKLPSSITNWFAGPRLGVDGIRQALKIHGRPILGYVVKSRTRADMTTVLNACRAALVGGVDLLVDDLLSTDPDGALTFTVRVQAISALVKEFNANKPTDRTTEAGYLVNVGASPWQAENYVAQAREAGAFGCLVDCFTMGFGTVHELIDRANDVDAPPLAFVATDMGSGIMGRNPDDEHLEVPLVERRFLRTGFSEALTAKLARLAGADGVHTGTADSECFHVAEYAHTHRSLHVPAAHLKRAFPVAEGDVQLHQVMENVHEMGTDVIIETASGIANHPRGVREGARAFRLLVGCLNDELAREDMDDVLNLLRHKYPQTMDPLLRDWKANNDVRIRDGWSAHDSASTLEALDTTVELSQLISATKKGHK
jgi:ribulose 1,5-bisphosphate carboxylase large subunit-like protein